MILYFSISKSIKVGESQSDEIRDVYRKQNVKIEDFKTFSKYGEV